MPRPSAGRGRCRSRTCGGYFGIVLFGGVIVYLAIDFFRRDGGGWLLRGRLELGGARKGR